MMSLPLEGVVIADFTRILAGPLCTMILADLGADVIKIEEPGRGDETRHWGPPFAGDDAAYFLSVNRNKRSIALDLKDPDDLAVAKGIVERADVVVENFRPGVMDRLGLGYETVRDLNPTVVYCSMPAYLAESARHLPGVDLQMQAVSGFMSITGEEGGEPVKMGVAMLAVICGLYSATGITAALRARSETGEGQRIEVGLFESSMAALVNQAANYLIGGVVPKAKGSAHPNIAPYQAFRASDGWFVMAAATDKQYRSACDVVGRPELKDDSRFVTNADRVVNRAELVDELNQVFGTVSVAHWVEVLNAAGVPTGPVRTIDQVFESEEGRSVVDVILDPVRGGIPMVRSPIRLEGPSRPPTPPPSLGEHTEEIRQWVEGSPGASESS